MTEQTKTYPTLPFKFSGEGGEYFKIWIVNLILSVLTLGIYSAWAKVRTNRYFYGNTSLENSAFEYHATPMMILKGRLIAIATLLIYILTSQFLPIVGLIFAIFLAILAPWAIVRSMQFNARMISYRNVRFSFHGTFKEAYRIMLFIPFLPIIIAGVIGLILALTMGETGKEIAVTLIVIGFLSMYLIFPYVQKLVTMYYINNQQYGQGKFSANLSTKKYYMIYFALLGWMILFMICTSIVAGVLIAIVGGGNMQALAQNDPNAILAILPYIGLIYIGFIAVSLWGKAYLEKNIRNYVFGNITLDDVMQLDSELKTAKLFGIYVTNTLLVILTLGLAYSWAHIRMKKYKIESTTATIKGNVSQYINQQQETQSALGEELGDAFDMDLGLGM